MEEQANYIKRIEIHRLWDRFDIAWDLRPDVNILSGINGVGKPRSLTVPSTIWKNFRGR